VAARTPSSGKHRRDQRREHLFRTRMCRPDRRGGVASSRHRQRQSGLEGPPSPPRSPFKAYSVRRGPMKVAFARSRHAGAHVKNDSPRCKEKKHNTQKTNSAGHSVDTSGAPWANTTGTFQSAVKASLDPARGNEK